MSTVKISELPYITRLNQDTTQTLIAGVDLLSGVTGKMTAKVIADSLYANNVLNVGNNEIVFPGVVAQFVGEDESYLQLNIQNTNANGSGDIVITNDQGTDESHYIDMGIQGSDATDGVLNPNDGYLFLQGDNANTVGNLVIGTISSAENLELRFVAGGYEEENVYAVFQTTQAHFLNNVVVDGTITGATITAMDNYSTSSFGRTNTSFATANSAGSFANGAFLRANGAASFANGAFTAANNVAESVSTINLTLLGAQNFANGAFLRANGAASFANGAFTKANNALANTTGTFGGDLTVAGNLVAQGISTTTGPLSTGNLIVTGTTSISGTASLAGALDVVGAVTMNATVLLSNSTFSNTEAALTISASPTVVTPANDGYMIHISGKNGVPSRVVTDSYGTGAYALYAGRAARGNVAYPTAIQTGDVVARYSSSGYGTTKYQTLGTGRIDFVAAENYTDANTGSQIQFWNCPMGSNTLTNILTLNGLSAVFSGVVNPQKGFIYTPRLPVGAQTAITIDYSTDSMIKANCAADVTISHSNFVSGKVVYVWLTNTSGLTRTITHGCSAINSTTNSTTFSMSPTSSAHMKFFSIDGDLANTFVTVSYA